jgi:hypothetical protein
MSSARRCSVASAWLQWPAVMERVPCNTGETRGRRTVTQNKKTPSGGGTHRRGGRGGGSSTESGGRLGLEVGGEERRCMRPCRGGSNAGAKKG